MPRIDLRLSSCLWMCLCYAALVSGCGDTTSSAVYRNAGPYAVGVTTLMLDDRGVEVWYPIDHGAQAGLEREEYFIRDWLSDVLRDILPAEINPPFLTDAYRGAPASEGPFPLVLFAHGAASYRSQSTFLTTHLASWGFVVASVDYLERNLLGFLGNVPSGDEAIADDVLSRMVADLLNAENERVGGPLEGSISTENIAITGHSAGGSTSIRFGDEPDVVAYIPLSAGIFGDDPIDLPDTPSLWLTGVADGIVDAERVEAAYEAAKPPKRLVLIDDVGHLGPTDICEIGETGGGVIAIAIEAGLPLTDDLIRLGTDGCQDEALTTEAWPAIRHFVTAELRVAFGIDEEPVGFADDVANGLPEVTLTYREEVE